MRITRLVSFWTMAVLARLLVLTTAILVLAGLPTQSFAQG